MCLRIAALRSAVRAICARRVSAARVMARAWAAVRDTWRDVRAAAAELAAIFWLMARKSRETTRAVVATGAIAAAVVCCATRGSTPHPARHTERIAATAIPAR